jgi:tellurite resistance protein TerA
MLNADPPTSLCYRPLPLGDSNRMIQTLPKGGNAAIPTGPIRLTVSKTAGQDIDVIALLVKADGKVRADSDMVYFNQPQHPSGTVTADGSVISIDLARVEPAISKVIIAVWDEDKPLDHVHGLRIQAGTTVAFEPSAPTTERVLILGEVYRRDTGWKFRAVGQGWDGGLAALLNTYGVTVDDEPAAAPTPPPPVAQLPPMAPFAPPPAPASATPMLPTAPQHPPRPYAAPRTINMVKGSDPVRLTKTAVITVTASWSSETDYDLYALVVTRDSGLHYVARFGAEGVGAMASYRGITQHGDAGRADARRGTAAETLTVQLDNTIAAVIPVAYSAQSNGMGSFHRYKVSLTVDNGAGERIVIDASNASRSEARYTCVPAIIHHHPDGSVWVQHVERYSKPHSESRPSARLTKTGKVMLLMDQGPFNDFK